MQAAAERRNQSANLTIAQCIRRSRDPYRASVASFNRRQITEKHKTFYFEDGSYLAFEISYAAVDDGMDWPIKA